MFLDHLPPAAAIGSVGRAFVEKDRGPGRERAVDDIGMPRDPAHVGGTPVDVVVAEVEDPFGRLFAVKVVAGGGVHDALGLAGRTARVKDVKRGLAIERLGRAIGSGLGS